MDGQDKSFPIFQIISKARNAHGLRLQDPRQYQLYCANRVRGIRKSLKLVRKSKTSVTKRITQELVLSDERYLDILLFSAERAWSHSNYLKTTQEVPSNYKSHHAIRRLNKAIRYASELSTLLQALSNFSAATRLEARAYLALLSGQNDFERKIWTKALQEFSIAKVIFSVLQPKSPDHLQYKEATGTVDPGLRYCAYQLHSDPSLGDLLDLAIQHLPKEDALLHLLKEIDPRVLEHKGDSNVASSMTSIKWRSRTATLQNPEIVVALLKVQDAQIALSGRRDFLMSKSEEANAMDDLLTAWADAEITVQKIINEENAARNQVTEQELQITFTYVSYHSITTRLKRDLLLIEEFEKKKIVGPSVNLLKDLVRLHDTIIQGIQQIYNLPGIAADTTLTADLDSCQAYYKASRCVLIARSYATLNETASALALHNRAQEYLDVINAPKSGEEEIALDQRVVTNLRENLDAEIARAHAATVLSTSLNNERGIQNKSLLETLQKYPNLSNFDFTNLVQFPPRLKQIPIKPFFFDVAFNYIGLNEKTTGKTESVANPAGDATQEDASHRKGWGFWGR